MKNQIKYYYNIEINSIKQQNSKYYINDNLLLVQVDPKQMQEIGPYVYKNKIYEIKKNKQNNYISIIDDKTFVLSEYKVKDQIINFDDVNNIIYINNGNLTWKNKWKNTVDYIEYQLENNSQKNLLIYKNMPYYIGLAENAIQLCNDITQSLYIQHVRVSFKQKLYDFYNPNNLIIDSKVRDISEYLKSCFFSENVIYPKIYLSNNEKQIFLARLLYPTYYFDQFNNYLQNKEVNINKYLNKAIEYEKYLKEICKLNNIMIDIEWLNKKSN